MPAASVNDNNAVRAFIYAPCAQTGSWLHPDAATTVHDPLSLAAPFVDAKMSARPTHIETSHAALSDRSTWPSFKGDIPGCAPVIDAARRLDIAQRRSMLHIAAAH